MTDYLLSLIREFKQKGVLIDSNLLLLFAVGSVDVGLIPNLARTAAYSANDFQLVERFIDYFPNKFTTPHVLAEASNLIGCRPELRDSLGKFIAIADEVFVAARELVTRSEFRNFGLTDAGLCTLSESGLLVLTDDNPIAAFLSKNKLPVVGLDHLRAIF